MPAVIDPEVCNRNWNMCFASRVCPQGAFSLADGGNVVIDSSLCADCTGPCTNFCDGYAIRYERDPNAFEILKRQTLGELTEQQAIEERLALEQRKQDDAAQEQGGVVEVTEETFVSEVLESEMPVVVDFWASWCGPCKQMAPVFEALATEYAGMLKFAKVNVDEQPFIAGQFRIQSIPTLLVFHKGRAIDGAVGALPKQHLQSLMYSILAKTREESPTPAAPLASE